VGIQKAVVAQVLLSATLAVVNLQALHHPASNRKVPHAVLNHHQRLFHAVQAVTKAQVVAASQ